MSSQLVSQLKAMLRPLLLPLRESVRTSKLREAQIEFLLNEVSDLRQLIRLLVAKSPDYSASIHQTADSFETQWHDLPVGRHLPGDPIFDRECIDTLCRYAARPSEWFGGKSVLDAGCGMGRWSRALCLLGAKVTAIDLSQAGLQATSALCQSFEEFSCRQHNLLDPLPFGNETFDMVWNYGVCHHTGDTRRVLDNVASGVKVGGLLFTMIYGEPRKNHPSDFIEINRYVSLRRATANLSFAERIAFLRERFPEDVVHGWFDAVSPRVNDLHRLDEIAGWLTVWGFGDIHTTFDSRNHHIIATRMRNMQI